MRVSVHTLRRTPELSESPREPSDGQLRRDAKGRDLEPASPVSTRDIPTMTMRTKNSIPDCMLELVVSAMDVVIQRLLVQQSMHPAGCPAARQHGSEKMASEHNACLCRHDTMSVLNVPPTCHKPIKTGVIDENEKQHLPQESRTAEYDFGFRSERSGSAMCE